MNIGVVKGFVDVNAAALNLYCIKGAAMFGIRLV